MEVVEKKEAPSLAGKYLTFCLAEDEYGIEILKVREIIGMMDITPIPQTPTFVKGVINLRGKILAVLDLRLKFRLPEILYTRETCIVIVEMEDYPIGIIVDHVSDVVEFKSGEVELPPSFGIKFKVEFLLGLGKKESKVITLLNIGKILSSEELVMIETQTNLATESL